MGKVEYDDFDFETGEAVVAKKYEVIDFTFLDLEGPYGPYSINHNAIIPAGLKPHEVLLEYNGSVMDSIRIHGRRPAREGVTPENHPSPYKFHERN